MSLDNKKHISFLPSSVKNSIRLKIKNLGIVSFMGIGLLIFLSLASYHPSDSSFNSLNSDNNIHYGNMLGVTGSYVSDILLQIFGYSSYLLCAFPMIWGLVMIKNSLMVKYTKFLPLFGFMITLSIVLGTLPVIHAWKLPVSYGGIIGSFFVSWLDKSDSTILEFLGKLFLFIVGAFLSYLLFNKAFRLDPDQKQKLISQSELESHKSLMPTPFENLQATSTEFNGNASFTSGTMSSSGTLSEEKRKELAKTINVSNVTPLKTSDVKSETIKPYGLLRQTDEQEEDLIDKTKHIPFGEVFYDNPNIQGVVTKNSNTSEEMDPMKSPKSTPLVNELINRLALRLKEMRNNNQLHDKKVVESYKIPGYKATVSNITTPKFSLVDNLSDDITSDNSMEEIEEQPQDNLPMETIHENIQPIPESEQILHDDLDSNENDQIDELSMDTTTHIPQHNIIEELENSDQIDHSYSTDLPYENVQHENVYHEDIQENILDTSAMPHEVNSQIDDNYYENENENNNDNITPPQMENVTDSTNHEDDYYEMEDTSIPVLTDQDNQDMSQDVYQDTDQNHYAENTLLHEKNEEIEKLKEELELLKLEKEKAELLRQKAQYENEIQQAQNFAQQPQAIPQPYAETQNFAQPQAIQPHVIVQNFSQPPAIPPQEMYEQSHIPTFIKPPVIAQEDAPQEHIHMEEPQIQPLEDELIVPSEAMNIKSLSDAQTQDIEKQIQELQAVNTPMDDLEVMDVQPVPTPQFEPPTIQEELINNIRNESNTNPLMESPREDSQHILNPFAEASLDHQTSMPANDIKADNTNEDQVEKPLKNKTPFILPNPSFLDESDEDNIVIHNELELAERAKLLEEALRNYKIQGEVMNVQPGPVVTLFEFEPKPGTKTSKVVNLAEDIARSLSAVSVRIAPIPGKSVIGIEMPNEEREMVNFRELVEDPSFANAKGNLPFILGKDIGGIPKVVDLSAMPHLLVSGTTGSGKSVAINTIIMSLLYRFTPDELRLVMVDPKMLEFAIYEDIPHLLTPIVTESEKAVNALQWAMTEMNDRYKLMADARVRNIEGFNKKIDKAVEHGEVLYKNIVTGFNKETGQNITEKQEMDMKTLPYIAIIIDELADLMISAGKEIEPPIQSLAQKARAAGIHLILATQRPSVNVITGTIKANFPSRMSFQLTSRIDSRTILDENGAEQLLGRGDMLYKGKDSKRPIRLHGPFVSDDEVERTVEFLKSQGEPFYIQLEPAPEILQANAKEENEKDPLYDQAVETIMQDGKASTSFIQRKLKIGYNRAARIIEDMEADGIVSPADRVGRRKILAVS